jgi:hypothetical protein
MNTSFVVKIKQLLDSCPTESLPGLHLSRQKFIINFVFAIIAARQVQQIALRFCSQADPASRLRRIQRFLADFLLDDVWLACLSQDYGMSSSSNPVYPCLCPSITISKSMAWSY